MKKLPLILLIQFIILLSCKETKKEIPSIDPGFTGYISGFTNGVISVGTTPAVRLMLDVSESARKNLEGQELFEFKPAIRGNVVWVDNRTIEFRPEQILPPGTVYNARFHLYRLFEVPDHLKTLKFQFQTMQQAISVNFEGLKSMNEDNLKWQALAGNLKTADLADMDLVETILEAVQDKKNLKIHWTHGEDGKTHEFVIDSIFRSDGKETVTVRWNGRVVGCKDLGEESVEIPPLGDFKLMNIQVVQQPEQYVSLYFSDPLNRRQDLKGLVYFESGELLKLDVSGNELRVYPASRLQGVHTLVIDEALRNSLDYRLVEGYERDITFASIRPDVALIGDGVILPSGNDLIFHLKQ